MAFDMMTTVFEAAKKYAGVFRIDDEGQSECMMITIERMLGKHGDLTDKQLENLIYKDVRYRILDFLRRRNRRPPNNKVVGKSYVKYMLKRPVSWGMNGTEGVVHPSEYYGKSDCIGPSSSY